MSISLLLEMAASSNPDRTAVVSGDMRLTTQQLSDLADGGAGVIAGSNAKHVAYVGTGGAMLPLLIFAAARAGLAFTPINYRLSAEGIQALIQRLPEPLVIVDSRYREMVGDASERVMVSDDFLIGRAQRGARHGVSRPRLGRGCAVHLGHHVAAQGRRTLAQQPDQLCHRHGRVRVGRADDAALICVPPYHIAGVGAALSNLYAGRKMVYLPNFDAAGMGAADQRRARHHRDGGAHHAGPDRHRARGRRRSMSCRRCATWPTAARKWACRWSAGRSNCCRMWASSTPTA